LPKAKTKMARLEQIARWLKVKHPTPFPVRLEFFKDSSPKEDFGETVREGKLLIIRINLTPPEYMCQLVLFHEWAHAAEWRHKKVEQTLTDHNPYWGIRYAKIYENFIDEGGDSESGKM
jgi:hypothetical protein